ncbi:NitT/TauT family transport system substrate-binding protein [Archangium gephyra]|uniref:Hydroxymethylpyrimidine ABC transporter, substrate-binding component n=1 Tax=Archangium gephyra TaxID=48 RepID=A0AAC8TDQ5_9BACT|nr:ABC transporter substrate-binding protein [Archangium gephyra]AKJ02067.1 Hydroxymethylpyrimidine ABC transporter, substrate-binding component [Archangium gephyra]REG34869.1 NitT/TauT family transport system substrate-binding protein [Archangium gephyra]
MNAPRPQSWMLAALLLLLCACTPTPEPRLRLGTTPWPGNEPLFLGQQLGLLPAGRVHLVEYMSSAQLMRAFRNGAIDAVTTTLEDVLSLEQLGHEPKVVLVLDISVGADCVMARPDMESLAALKGRRIRTEESLLGMYMLTRVLEQAGLRREDVRLDISPMEPQVAAWQRGELDAVVTSEPYCQRLASVGARKLFDSSRLPGEIVDVVVVRKEFLEAWPRHVDTLLHGWFATLAWKQQHPQEATQRMAGRLGLDPQHFQEALSGVRFMDEQAQHSLLTGAQPGLRETLERMGEVLRHHQLLPGLPGRTESSRMIDAAPLLRVSP